MTCCSNPDKSKFIAEVLQALHLTTDTFVAQLAQHSRYEMMLFLWINKLYKKGTTSEDAIQLIYKARNILLFSPNAFCNTTK